MTILKLWRIAPLLLLAGSAWGQTELRIIDTFAGNGSTDFETVDGAQLAKEISLFEPYGLAVADDGAVYVSDSRHHRIVKIDAQGIAHTVAGNGERGDSGDGGLASNATLAFPRGLALDADGNLYIADFLNQKIRKVGTDGIITTVAGTGDAGYDGDTGPAIEAMLSAPYDVATDTAGNIYFSESGNHVVRKIDENGIITTLAGTGTGGFNEEDGLGTEVRLERPAQLAVAENGSVFVADSHNNRIRRIDTDGMVTTIAGRGVIPELFVDDYTRDGREAATAILSAPHGLVLDGEGGLYVGVWGHQQVRRITPDGLLETIAGTGRTGFEGDGGPALQARFRSLNSLALDTSGVIYVADTSSQRVRRIGPNQPPVASFTLTPDHGQAPLNVTLDASASTDPDGEIAAYHWQLPDAVANPGTGAVEDVAFTETGVYNITLTVTDNYGNSDSLTRVVRVGNVCAGAAAFSAETNILSLPMVEVKTDAAAKTTVARIAANLTLEDDGTLQVDDIMSVEDTENEETCHAVYTADDGRLIAPRVDFESAPNIPFTLELQQQDQHFMIESVEIIE